MEDRLQRIYENINYFMRWLTFPLLIAAAIVVIAILKTENNLAAPSGKNINNNPVKVEVSSEEASLRIGGITMGLKNYAEKNGFNNRYCFLVDMKMPSGSKRFHIFDLQNNQILQSGLVAHGSGNQNLSDSIAFSNVVGSNCTSLGRYIIGKPYFGKFGLAYKLYGLDKTNCNAFNRFVVLHSHVCVPDKTVEPLQICECWGCPTVSPVFLSCLKAYIEKSKRPLLLWIFN